MRDYGKITPAFWIGRTGRSLRGNPEAQIVAAYLLTAPSSTMIGLYYCPIATISHDTGLLLEAASMGLRRIIEAEFCTYDEETDWVWVHEMASFQIEPSLSPKDKRVVGIARELERVPDGPVKQGFYARYRSVFHLPKWHSLVDFETSPLKGASKPHRSQEQEQEQSNPSQGEGSKVEGWALGIVPHRQRALATGSYPDPDDGEDSF